MFSRIKDALDRTIAEEQARHRTLAEQRTANTSTNDAVASPSTDSAKKPGQGGTAHPDPAVFEAAIRQEDDSDSASRSATPNPSVPGDNTKGAANNAISEKNSSAQIKDGDTSKQASADASQSPDLPPQVKSKLKRLEKLESNYQEILRSYRIAHSQIKNFERAVQEHTPLSSIKDPSPLIEYINQFGSQNAMYVDELKRVSAEKDELKKKVASSETESATLKSQIAALEETVKTSVKVNPPNESPADKAPEKSDEQENMFSYDDELSKLQTELASKTEDYAKLELQVKTLQEELAASKEQAASAGQDAQEANDEPGPDTRDAEINLLKKALEDRQEQLRKNQASLENEQSLHASKTAEIETLEAVNKERNAELEKLSEDNSEMTKQIASLNGQLEEYRKTDATTQLLELAPKTAEPTTPTTGSAKKKNKKKKKGGAPQTASDITNNKAPESIGSSSLKSHDAGAITELSMLEKLLAAKQEECDKRVRQMNDREEEIAMLRESLIENGEDATEAKRKNQELEQQITELQAANSELEKKLNAHRAQVADMEEQMKLIAANTTASTSKQEAEYESIKKELEELDIQKRTLQSDLGASQKLAQDRFKELSNFKEILAKAQTEMKSLRQDSSDLKTARDELASKQNDFRVLEKREKELKNEPKRLLVPS
ncbi:hypothetical protein EV127DRAFT_89890 [Xylaria flabelliformis]|nr:hypothetical protein EV127DRAFT_89890 [Xylaria flabelliformis]